MVERVGTRRADEHSESFRLRDRDGIFVPTTAPAEFKWKKAAYLEVNETWCLGGLPHKLWMDSHVSFRRSNLSPMCDCRKKRLAPNERDHGPSQSRGSGPLSVDRCQRRHQRIGPANRQSPRTFPDPVGQSCCRCSGPPIAVFPNRRFAM